MTIEELKEEYVRINPKSQKAYQDTCELIPGGVSANIKHMAPFPLFMNKANGAKIYDLDEHEYIDYVLAYGPLIHGHGREEIIKSAESYFRSHGTVLFGTSHTGELALAKVINKYYPSMENIRYTNTGTEATLLSLRLAKAYTGKKKIAKFEGHYHGGHNQVLVSVHPNLEKAGTPERPKACPASAGLSLEDMENTIVLPFNDIKACNEIIKENHKDIAAVILEPFMGGTIEAKKDFIYGLRNITEKYGIVLIFDEVKTGFCVKMGGAQAYYQITPDLTTLGKIVGAGLPIGVLGGKKEIMHMIAPGESFIPQIGIKHTKREENLYHSGTYNGQPVILHMGLESIELLEKEFDELEKRTIRLKEGIKKIYHDHGIRVITPGVGAMFNVLVTDKEEVLDFRELCSCDGALRRKIDYALLLEGIYNKPGKRYNMSTAHTDSIIDDTLEKMERGFNRLNK